MGGFKTTGVYPVNRTAITVQTKESGVQSGLGFILLCSPMPSTIEKLRKIHMFSEAEVEGFEERYKSETKDSQANDRYHQWVQMYHPDQQIPEAITASSTAKVLIPAPNSAIEKFLQVPPNPAGSSVKSSSCGRVLISCENLKLLEEKKLKKR